MQKEVVNISMIADMAGVSKASVSNYLNNRSGKLSKETSDRIAKVIKDCNYIPNFGARRIRKAGLSKTIGIVLKDTLLQSMFTIPFYSFMMKGIGNVLGKAGYATILIPEKDHDSRSSLDYIKELSSGFVDGFILFDIHVDDIYVKELSACDIPFISMGNVFDDTSPNYVGTDYYSGSRDAVNYLVSCGCTNLAVSIGIPESIVSRQLFDGFSDELAANGLSVNSNFVIQGKSDMDESIFDELLTLFQQDNRPDGILLSERHFYDLSEVAKVLGFNLFDTVRVVLYNYFFRMVEMDFSYLDIPYEEIGAAGATNLLNLLEGKTIQPLLFKPRLVRK